MRLPWCRCQWRCCCCCHRRCCSCCWSPCCSCSICCCCCSCCDVVCRRCCCCRCWSWYNCCNVCHSQVLSPILPTSSHTEPVLLIHSSKSLATLNGLDQLILQLQVPLIGRQVQSIKAVKTSSYRLPVAEKDNKFVLTRYVHEGNYWVFPISQS